MGQPGMQRATELSGNGTLLWHAIKPEAKNHRRWIAEGWSWDPYRGQRKPPSHSISLLTRTPPLSPEAGTAQHGQ